MLPLTRADLPDKLTPETLRTVPVGVLRRLARHGNGVLDDADQRAFDAALKVLMTQMAARVNAQVGRARWERGGPGAPDAATRERIARRLEAQLSAMESLAPGVDWSAALAPVQTETAAPLPAPPDPAPEAASPADDQTVTDVEHDINDQVELVTVMNEIAEVSRRTLALEQEREAANTRGLFFGLLVSIAVIAAGWAPLVMATWPQRLWIGGLTLVTSAFAGAVYVLVMRRQRALASDPATPAGD